MAPSPTPITVVGLGEAVFDLFADKAALGGAPLNLAVQAHQLLAPLGGRGVVMSRIGRDALGARLQAELRARGVSLDFIQLDNSQPTGQVRVRQAGASPEYEIAQPSAWDFWQFTESERDLAGACHAVGFGTLGQRHPVARAATQAFLAAARGALKLFDVNLRMDCFNADILEAGCRAANIVKLNETELPRVANGLGLPISDAPTQAAALRERFSLEAVIFTRGENGTAACTAEGWFEGTPATFKTADGADSVGAGDACAAAVLVSRLLGRDWPATLALANRHGAFVASQPGAVPPLPPDLWAHYGLR